MLRRKGTELLDIYFCKPLRDPFGAIVYASYPYCLAGDDGNFDSYRECPVPLAIRCHCPVQLVISSVQTLKLMRVLGPNVVAMATSMASRPLAISTRPILGMLLRASKVYQRPPR